MLKYGVVGTGWITRSFIEGARLAGGMTLGAVYSRTREKGEEFAAECGENVPVYTDLAEMAENSGISAAYVASPNILHAGHSRLLLERGLHVICEKPITVTPEQLSDLWAYSRERELVYIEAIMMMHQPVLAVLKSAMERIGRITTARFDFSQFSSKYSMYRAGALPNIFNPALATGCLMDLGVYCVYAAAELFGYPQKITAAAGFLDSGADGYGSAVLDYEDKQVTLTYSKLGQSFTGSEIIGDAGTIVIDSISRLAGMRLIAGGHETVLIGNVSKAELMGHEAKRFSQYAYDPAAYRDEIDRLNVRALEVNRIMAEIRDKAGINFEY